MEIIMSFGLPIFILCFYIWIRKDKYKKDKKLDKHAEKYSGMLETQLNDKNIKQVCFNASRKSFDRRNKKGNRILYFSILLVLIFFVSIPTWFKNFSYENIYFNIATFLLMVGMIGITYWVAKYHNTREEVHLGILFLDKLKNTVFYDTTNSVIFNKLASTTIHDRTVRKAEQLGRKAGTGLDNPVQVVYAIRNITDVVVKDVTIEIIGDIIMTSFDNVIIDSNCFQNPIDTLSPEFIDTLIEPNYFYNIVNANKFVDTNYINDIEINKTITFYSRGKQVKMHSKEVKSINIPRAYDDFEEFLRNKGFDIPNDIN